MVKRRAPLKFREWIEATIRLPLGVSADPGRITLPIYLREIADAFAEPGLEKITVQKSARVGFSTLLDSLVAWHMTKVPAPILIVLPAEADARNAVVTIEDIFDASPRLKGKLPDPSISRSDRNTLLIRRGRRGASLRLVGANAPRNLRAIAARVVLVDEADALQDTEGDVIKLAEARSLTFPDRLTIIGGTPLLASTSRVARSYAESDQRVYECACPSCDGFAELRWRDFTWEPGMPKTVEWKCPHCGALHDERNKAQMVRDGRWRALHPEVLNHRGYRLSALISSLPHATWQKIVAEFEAAEGDDERMKAFQNLLLGEAWSEEVDEVDEGELSTRAEPFDLDDIPPEVLAITVGGDCQGDRVELTVVGHTREGAALVLAHVPFWGSPTDDDVWVEVDAFLKQRWRHPGGGQLKVDAAAIDSGGTAGTYDKVMAFSNARLPRKVLACKGMAGFARPSIVPSKTKKGRLFIVGADVLKSQILTKLARGTSIRFSRSLDAAYYEQLAAERRIVRQVRGRPVARFELRPGVKRNEALDTLVLALAARAALALNAGAFDQREREVATPLPPTPTTPTVYRSQWMSR